MAVQRSEEILISIVVPVYKIEETYLYECLNSLKNQTLKEIEIILIDDGSPDNCGKICDNYAQVDNRFKVIHKSNQGVSAARNDGISLACGKWLTFVDADDWVELNMCKSIYEKAIQLDVDVQYFGGYHNFNDLITIETRPFHQDMEFKNENDREDLQLMVLGRDYKLFTSCKNGSIFCNTVCKLIKTSILIENNLRFDLDLTHGEDGSFNLHLIENCNHFAYLDQCFYHYRMRSESANHLYRYDAMERVVDFVNVVEAFKCEYSKSEIFEEGLMCRCYDLIFENIYPCYLHAENKNSILNKLILFQRTMSRDPFKEAINTVKLRNFPIKLRIKTFLLKINAGWLMLLIIIVLQKNNINRKRLF